MKNTTEPTVTWQFVLVGLSVVVLCVLVFLQSQKADVPLWSFGLGLAGLAIGLVASVVKER